MPGTCAIISGGEYAPVALDPSIDFVIACDKGYAYAVRLGIVPNLVMGDLDSLRAEVAAGIPVVRAPAEKDDTDTMLAVRYAVEHGFEKVELLCALGGRFDHCLANLQAAAYAAGHGLEVTMADSRTQIYVLSGKTLTLPRRQGYSLSLFSLTDSCTHVTTTGLKYPLQDATLTNRFPLGVSNEWLDEAATISVESGVMLAVLSKL